MALKDRYDLSKIIGTDLDAGSYSRMPVSAFGMSMLSEMGFYEGRGLGRNPEHALHHPIEFVPRNHRQGLGADPKPWIKGQRDFQKGQNYVKIGEKVEIGSKKNLEIGVWVDIKQGKHKGLRGQIVKMTEEEVWVQLDLNEENVRVGRKEVEWSERQERGMKGDGGVVGVKKKIGKEKKKDYEGGKRKLRWVVENIRVRVISKKFENGKFYNNKVIVNDIIDGESFSVVTEKGDVVVGLREKELETVIPGEEGKVMVVRGENKGKIAVLKMRDKEKNKVIVQIMEDLQFLEMTQDDVCEYIST